MKVVLTHDRADFDAIACQIGLTLLEPGTLAVRPLTVNANVERFIADHKAVLPLHARDRLPREPVEHAWYVDTTRASDLPGMRPDTARSLLDHHVPAPSGASAERWRSIDVQAVGACATLIAERLSDAGIRPSSAEATLLLLGIHEDTGSLTFGSTTRRDAHAVGWLIEAGAVLDDLERYLEKRLDAEARALLARLSETAETVERAGARVAVAVAAAPGFAGEIAPLAGRLLTAQGADAACILVDLGSIIQLAARSRADAIDVAALARSLGGGGHRRAAAAAIEVGERSLDAVRDAVVSAVREGRADGEVLRVMQIMTRGEVVTLPAELTVEAALAIARRHGHEGYPVVAGDEIEAIVDRKDLDLAAHHGMLDLPLRALVARARVVASPDLPVADLVGLMRRRGAVHVPVVEERKIVGIVTRTDLVHALSERLLGKDARDEALVPLAALFEAAEAGALRSVAEVAHSNGRRIYLVGGIPRDLLLGRPIDRDIDVVVDGDAIALARRVQAALGGELTVHTRFGTATWRSDDVTIDLVTARAEYYRAPGELPVVQPGNLTSDLRRRDFTQNALAIALDGDDFGRVIDRFGGLEDMRAGILRTLHPLSFVEDPTRIVRAVRFEIRLGMRMDEETERAAREAMPRLASVSGARISAELRKLLGEPEPGLALARLQSLGETESITPGVEGWPSFGPLHERALDLWASASAVGMTRAAAPDPEDVFALWLVSLGAAGAPVARRLDRPRADIERVEHAVALLAEARLREPAASALRPSELHSILGPVDEKAQLLAAVLAPDASLERAVLRSARIRRDPPPPIDGGDVLALGIPEGPEIGRILDSVGAAWVDGDISDRREALELASRLAADAESPPDDRSP